MFAIHSKSSRKHHHKMALSELCMNILPANSDFVSGGMALQGNSWSCSCENVWLGRWLRRWMREALQLHTSVVERGQTIRAVVRTITCKNSDGSERPLLELDTDTPCQLPPVSGSGPRRDLVTVISCLLLTLLLLLRVSHH